MESGKNIVERCISAVDATGVERFETLQGRGIGGSGVLCQLVESILMQSDQSDAGDYDDILPRDIYHAASGAIEIVARDLNSTDTALKLRHELVYRLHNWAIEPEG